MWKASIAKHDRDILHRLNDLHAKVNERTAAHEAAVKMNAELDQTLQGVQAELLQTQGDLAATKKQVEDFQHAAARTPSYATAAFELAAKVIEAREAFDKDFKPAFSNVSMIFETWTALTRSARSAG